MESKALYVDNLTKFCINTNDNTLWNAFKEWRQIKVDIDIDLVKQNHLI